MGPFRPLCGESEAQFVQNHSIKIRDLQKLKVAFRYATLRQCYMLVKARKGRRTPSDVKLALMQLKVEKPDPRSFTRHVKFAQSDTLLDQM